MTGRLACLVLGFATSVPAAAAAQQSTPLISFWSDRAGRPGVWVMRPDGSGARLLTSPSANVKHSDFSPDGRWLVFDGQPPGSSPRRFDFDIQQEQGDVLVMRADGSHVRNLTRTLVRDENTGSRRG